MDEARGMEDELTMDEVTRDEGVMMDDERWTMDDG
jgi:hypothetical protein